MLQPQEQTNRPTNQKEPETDTDIDGCVSDKDGTAEWKELSFLINGAKSIGYPSEKENETRLIPHGKHKNQFQVEM